MIVKSTRFRRTFAAVATVALTLVGLATVPAPASASEVITPSATTVAVGGSITVTASGCDRYVETETSYTWQQPRILLVTGVGATERAIPVSGGDELPTLTVPGWVDPDEAAVLRGACVEVRHNWGGTREEVEVFAYPEVPIDVTPAEGEVRTVELALDRNTAGGGQVVLATVSGCRAGDYAVVSLLAGTDLTLGGAPRQVTGTQAYVLEDGPVTAELDLIDDYDYPPTPLAEGDYVVSGACYALSDGYKMWPSEPAWFFVRGAGATGSITVDRGTAEGTVAIAGDGCIGRQVTVRIRGDVYGPGESPIDETFVVDPSPEGDWSLDWAQDAFAFYVTIFADCGDPMVDGFRYQRQSWYEDGYNDQWVGRLSPTTSPVGGQVQVHVSGRCDDGPNVVQVVGDDGSVLSEGPVVPGRFETGSATVTAPSAPGFYNLSAVCGGRPSYPGTLEVFTPGMISATAPLPAVPSTGWPDSGGREEFRGSIGPIRLPKPYDGELHSEVGVGSLAADLGPSGLGIEVPRPAGDFAITKLSFDLVDEHGNPVGHSNAHLHHMVIANMSSSNPACPGSTFGLPGEIIAAAGAERTALDFGGPYGLVVNASDPWLGVYEVMNMLDEEQTVYLSYEMEIRRDIENVRPVRTYFGSATGCGSFTWTIDGSGIADQQGHYITVASNSVLVGAGGHIHNGGLRTELRNDRGRLLCRNELVTGDHHHPDPDPDPGPTTTTTIHDHLVARSVGPPGATPPKPTTFTVAGLGDGDDGGSTSTTVVDIPDEYDYPPEMYPDDPPIHSITTCRPHERLTAGERLYFEATYSNDRPRSGVMGIFMLYVWEGGGPATPPGPPGTTTTTIHDHSTPTTGHDHSTPTTGHDHGTPTTGHDHGTPTTGHDHGTPTTGHDHGGSPDPDAHGGHGSGGHDVDGHVAGEHGADEHGGHVAGEHGAHVGAARPAVAHHGHAHYAG